MSNRRSSSDSFNSGRSSWGNNSYSENGRRDSPGHFNRQNSNPDDELPSAFASARNKQSDRLSYQDFQEVKAIVEDQFNKRITLNPPEEGWSLPDPETLFTEPHWTIQKFQKMKVELNEVKSKLDHYNLEEWHRHTRSMNRAGNVQYHLRNRIAPELLTQAWCKFYENVMAHKLIPSAAVKGNRLVSFHLCEAPGAFITSLNHYLRLNHPNIEWKWTASTLNPYYEGNPLSNMINDDRFIMKTMDNWNFGVDDTGDLMLLDNLVYFEQTFGASGDIHLITADGSIDCQDDPGEQESVVSMLHYCETIAALSLLAPGGSYLLKMFTMYEESSICLMYLLCNAFNSVTVNKPATSKEGNSEVYVVCLDYKGSDFMKPYLEILKMYYTSENPPTAMFRKSDIPIDFRKELHRCANFFKKLQIDVIERNIDAYENEMSKSDTTKLKKVRYMIAEEFITRYKLRAIDEDLEVVGKSKLKLTWTLNLDPRHEEGSFYDRCQRKKLSSFDRLLFYKADIEKMVTKWLFKENIGWLRFSEFVEGLRIQAGKPISVVNSSKFCLGRILGIRNDVSVLVKEMTEIIGHVESKKCDGQKFFDWLTNELNLRKYRKKELEIIDFDQNLWSLMEERNFQRFEKRALKYIMDFIDTAWRGQNLLLIGYPLLTRLNVGIVYMLCHMFERVGFVKPVGQNFAIMFEDFRKWHPNMENFYEEVHEAIDYLEREGKYTVLELVRINNLCEYNKEGSDLLDTSFEENNNGNDETRSSSDGMRKFYKCVTEMNNICVIEQLLDIIDSIQNSPATHLLK